MTETWDIYGTHTDRWGFTRYSLAIHAPQSLVSEVMAFRDVIGLSDLTSEPHVSISASLYLPVDLGELEHAIADAAEGVPSFRVLFADPAVYHRESSGGLAVLPDEALLELRKAVGRALDGRIQAAGDPARPYHPHLTLYQGASTEESSKAREAAPQCDFGDGFDVTSIELVGRVGTPRGGTRTIIRSFGLAN